MESFGADGRALFVSPGTWPGQDVFSEGQDSFKKKPEKPKQPKSYFNLPDRTEKSRHFARQRGVVDAPARIGGGAG